MKTSSRPGAADDLLHRHTGVLRQAPHAGQIARNRDNGWFARNRPVPPGFVGDGPNGDSFMSRRISRSGFLGRAGGGHVGRQIPHFAAHERHQIDVWSVGVAVIGPVSQQQLVERRDENFGRPGGPQLLDRFPEDVLLDRHVDRDPAWYLERHDSRRL